MASDTVDVSVGYGICVDGDLSKPKKAGSTIPVKLRLCTADGTNLSSPGVSVTALGDVRASGKANPGNVFRFTDDGYIFNLSTKGMSAGVHELEISVDGDPTVHRVGFVVR